MDSDNFTGEIDRQRLAAGISRSGRIRKKASKLTDFESLSELETNISSKKFVKMPTSQNKLVNEDSDDSDGFLDQMDDVNIKDEPLEEEEDLNDFDDVDVKEDDDDEDDSLQIDEDSNDDAQRDGASYSQANSLYLSEKLGKKNYMMVKDGQVIQRKKAQRKDKGKSRFTAYMLWAKEVRQDIIDANPDMDFSAVNKRLGEMWAIVSNNQKYNWRRRAKRLAAKGNQMGSMITTGKPGKQTNLLTKSNLINKGGGVKSQSSRISKTSDSSSHGTISTIQKTPAQTPRTSRISSDLSPSNIYQVNGCSPIDVAAHLKLLGESLNNIGQKLKEHEGQIAVSGSLSVLLDSMLCVMGPLACLVNQVDELKGAIPDETLTSVLDNIAYIVPGIV